MIPDYVRGLLSPAEAREVEAAIAAFPEIGGELEGARVYYKALNQIPEVKASAGFLRGVNSAIDYKPFRQRLQDFFFEPLYLKLPIELAGVAACIIILLVITNPFRPQERAELAMSTAPAATAKKAAPVPEETKQLPGVAADHASAQASVEQTQPRPAPSAGELVAAASASDKKAELPAAVPAAHKELQPLKKYAAAAPALKTAAKAKEIYAEAAPVAAAPAAEAPAAAAPMAEAPAVAAVRAPAPAPARLKQQIESAPAGEEIGTIELAYTGSGTTGTGAAANPAIAATAAAAILRTYDPNFQKTWRNGKLTFACTFPPGRLSALISDLGQPFAVTTHLFPYDAQHTRLVTVSFIIQ